MRGSSLQGYSKDLAYIHDAGFRDYALQSAPGLLQLLGRHGIRRGLVVDLGCGSGRWARELNRAGYEVFGVDQSAAMIRLARRIAPESHFTVASLLEVKLPQCAAITSIGECFNYTFDERNSRKELVALFRRAYHALNPGGVLIFDIAEPHRLPPRLPQETWIKGLDWTVFVTVDGNRKHNLLRRHIACSRKTGRFYRRSQETHTLRLYRAADLITDLKRCGFKARRLNAYGQFRLPPGITAILATKPFLNS